MLSQDMQNRNEVKSIKFHHRVKRFYHKNLFRKIYTVAIIGLVAANIFSMVKYASFADGYNCSYIAADGNTNYVLNGDNKSLFTRANGYGGDSKKACDVNEYMFTCNNGIFQKDGEDNSEELFESCADSCLYEDIYGGAKYVNDSESAELYVTKLGDIHNPCDNYKHNFQCNDGTFKYDGQDYYGEAYESCEMRCSYFDENGDISYLYRGEDKELYTSNRVQPGDTCDNYKHSFTCYEGGIFKLDGNEYSSDLYSYCEVFIPSTYTVTFTIFPEGYGSVDQATVIVDEGTAVEINDNTVTLGTEIVTATPTADTQQYDYSFVNRTNNCGDTVSDDCSIIANFSRDEQKYTITWKDGETTLKTEELEYGSMPSYTPTKDGYTFKGWTPSVVAVEGDATYTAVWEEISNNTTPSYSGRGGRSPSSSNDSHNSADDKNTSVDKNETKTSEENKSQIITDNTDSQKSSDTESKGQKVPEIDMQRYNTMYTPEQNTAYQFAYHNKITTVPTIKEAKMNTPLTRIEMAKMLSYYAMNVLGQTPDHGAGVVNFKDVSSKLDAQYDNAVTLAYQLGIMGINMPNNEFRPNDKVTRAEFATALSRMIYEMEDGTGRLKYYEPHIARLYNEGIINNTNPKLQELRGYVMTMLMRASE